MAGFMGDRDRLPVWRGSQNLKQVLVDSVR